MRHERTFGLSVAATLALLALFALASQSHAQPREDKEPMRVPRTDSEIRVDARLDEEAWRDALVVQIDTEVRPADNEPAPVLTDVLLTYSESHLYAAFRAYDPDPSQIRARVCDRDEIWDDDWVALILDTHDTQRGSTELFCNPCGVQGDCDEGVSGVGSSWDTIWDSAGRITDEGYIVEMAVPFSSLSFQRKDGEQVWGFDAVRSYPRSARHHLGAFPRNPDDNCYYCQMEKLIGFEGATPGNNIELDPTFNAIRTDARDGFPNGDMVELDTETDAGLTARWGITPNVKLSAAINPDFSQVEADVVQLDINERFTLAYPEKRPFFLEGGGIFRDVHTRTISDPDWGVKLTGREGRNTFGALVAQDAITNLVFPDSDSSSDTTLDTESTVAAARFTRDFGDNNYWGVSLNSREADGYSNRVGIVDTRFWLSETERFILKLGGSTTSYPDAVAESYGQPDGDFDDSFYSLNYNHMTNDLCWYVFHNNFGKDFRTDLGLTRRVGYENYGAGWGHTWWNQSGGWYTYLNVSSQFLDYWRDDEGRVISKGADVRLDWQGPMRSFFSARIWKGQDAYEGDPHNTWQSWYDAGFWLSGDTRLTLGTMWGDVIDYDNDQVGRQLTISPRIEHRFGRHLQLELDHTYSRLEVPGGRLYTANLSYAKGIYQFTRRAFLRAILQYADYEFNDDLYVYSVSPEYRHLSSQLLFSYKINPQTVLFLGYSDGHFGNQDIEVTQYERAFFAKIGYAWVL